MIILTTCDVALVLLSTLYKFSNFLKTADEIVYTNMLKQKRLPNTKNQDKYSSLYLIRSHPLPNYLTILPNLETEDFALMFQIMWYAFDIFIILCFTFIPNRLYKT